MYLPANGNPSCLQATLASVSENTNSLVCDPIKMPPAHSTPVTSKTNFNSSIMIPSSISKLDVSIGAIHACDKMISNIKGTIQVFINYAEFWLLYTLWETVHSCIINMLAYSCVQIIAHLTNRTLSEAQFLSTAVHIVENNLTYPSTIVQQTYCSG